MKLAASGHPVIYSTVVGGTGSDSPSAIAVAADGAVWVTGNTTSTDFPLVNPLQSNNPETQGNVPLDGNAFLFRLAPGGAAITFSTYIAAVSSGSAGHGLVVDADGSAVLAGVTCGAGLTTTPGAVQGTFRGGCDAFVTRFTAAGALLRSTFLGGTGVERFATVTLGPQGDVVRRGNHRFE